MDRPGKWLHLAPRVLSVAFVLFLALFSLDVFEIEASLGELVLGFLIHNIPSLLLAIVTVFAWKRDLVGAISFFAATVFYIWFIVGNLSHSGLPLGATVLASLTIAGPALVISALYLANWIRRRRMNY
ncbi:MAG TPA: hypothetical protein VK905_02170 [Bacillota bacterium]|jgi:hypothetical protein|nr:hypothetical protein [Bacillota bacterium]